jgi:hypothetical protein
MKVSKMNDIELIVRLKYQVCAGANDWEELRDSYPEEVRDILGKKWRALDDDYVKTLTNAQQWNMYIDWLVEELCAYESKQHG